MFKEVTKMLDHNPKHSIKVFNNRVCARCFGLYAGGIIPFVLFAVLYANGFEFSFLPIFIISWVMSGICLADWSSVKLKLRKGSNKWRLFSGACLGIAYSMYIWLLPIPWISKLISLMLINSSFAVIVYCVRCKEYNLSLKNPITQNIRSITAFSASPLAVVSCGQTGGCGSFCNCCPGGGCCCISPLCCCIGICPIICIMKSAMDKKAPPKGVKNAKK